jgi:hypothetical protein
MLNHEDVTVFSDPIDLLAYRRDTSVVPAGQPDSIARPNNLQGLCDTVRRANEAKTPIYVRGGGSMYAGGVNPHAGGVVVDMTGLNRIVDIDLERGIVVVEPGVLFGSVLKALKPHGMTIGIVPLTGPAATVGGAASSNALGTGSVRFQSFADEVVGLEVVLADGSVVRTGSAAADAAGFFMRHAFGPDLTGLFLGADATLGVISKLALWLHPLPEARQTFCLGFDSVEAGAKCITALQNQEQLQEVWYASAYDSQAIQGRMGAAFPDKAAENWPKFAIGFDAGANEATLSASIPRIKRFSAAFGGSEFLEFNEHFYRKLRYDETYWYSFAGYFTRSRCGLLMTSLPTNKLPAFYRIINEMRSNFPDFLWAPGAVLCRRGLHGGVVAFYDEQEQWEAMQSALAVCAQELLQAGCVPYKSGKIWAKQLRALGSHHDLLIHIKAALDPKQILSPGNLGL